MGPKGPRDESSHSYILKEAKTGAGQPLAEQDEVGQTELPPLNPIHLLPPSLQARQSKDVRAGGWKAASVRIPGVFRPEGSKGPCGQGAGEGGLAGLGSLESMGPQPRVLREQQALSLDKS